MPIRTAEATWNGGLRDGEGETVLGSGAWRGGYSYRSRFTDEEPARSNPEELLGAAHASCFSLALANLLEQEGYEPEEVHTTAECHLEMKDDEGPTITRMDLQTEVDVQGIEEAEFQNLAQEAREGCPVSRALAGVTITLEASQ